MPDYKQNNKFNSYTNLQKDILDLEKKYFDIPFNLGNNFFTNTKEIKDYIDHFPAYLKKPNKIFQQYFKFYQP